MRFLIFIAMFVSCSAFAQRDTIRVSQLDQTLFGQPEIQKILFVGYTRPINFFYSNVFEFRNKPFTGVATELYNQRLITIYLAGGRITYLSEFNTGTGRKEYVFARMNSDTLLAVDTSWRYQYEQRSKLFRSGEQLRVEYKGRNESIRNGRYEKCLVGECTDDGWSVYDIQDGLYRTSSLKGYGWATITYKDGHPASPWKVYYPDSTLHQNYETDYYGDPEGLWMEYWPNGRLSSMGIYRDHEKHGMWTYWDSLAVRTSTEWYSFPEWNEGQSHVDSTILYYPDGSRKSFYSEVWFKTKCRYYDGENGSAADWTQRYTNITYYYGTGRRQEMNIEYGHQCDPVDEQDTTRMVWYPDGTLHILELRHERRFEFYPNGAVKCRSNTGSVRDGEYLLADSLGNVLMDRTYVNGTVVKIRDNFPVRDSSRSVLAQSLEGLAAVAMFPEPMLKLGGYGELVYFNTRLPDWRDSLFIPDHVIDSIAYSIAGAFTMLPEDVGIRDSLFAFAREFHPAENEWYYTLEVQQEQVTRWMDSCKAGVVFTANNEFDWLLRTIKYEVIAYSSVSEKPGVIGKCFTVIRTKRPLNFVAMHKGLYSSTGPYVVIHCGQRAAYRDFYFLAYRPCNGRPDRDCPDYAYVNLYVVTRHLNWGHLRYVSHFFIVNSDQTLNKSEHYPDITREKIKFQNR